MYPMELSNVDIMVDLPNPVYIFMGIIFLLLFSVVITIAVRNKVGHIISIICKAVVLIVGTPFFSMMFNKWYLALLMGVITFSLAVNLLLLETNRWKG